jgi:glycosyltransferase involved in cell wall biosynthesis
VGNDAVGGSEQILAALDRALTAAGHHSVVIAAEGSKVQGTLIASPRAINRLDDSAREWGRRVHRQLLYDTLDRYPVDLIHMHSLDFHRYLPSCGIPVLATLHLPPDWYPAEIFNSDQSHFYMNCVSRTQQQACPSSRRPLELIPNGVDVDRLEVDVPKRGFALSLGRICPEKGFHFALDAARNAEVELLLAGEVFPYESHLSYFATEIEPRLDGARKFIGKLQFLQKRRFLSEAKCLVIPSTVAETSSLVAMEALACGTPVVAFGSGALPEVVEHGRTGLIVSTVKEMSEALSRVSELSSDACREAARARFSSRIMEERYFDLYGKLIDSHSMAHSSALELRFANG